MFFFLISAFGKLVYKVFIVNVAYMHLSATSQILTFVKGHGPASPLKNF